MFLQLNPPVPLETPKGKAWAIAMIDYGPHWDLQWVTFLQDSGQCWTFTNQDIRQEQNYTFGLPSPSPIHHKEHGFNGSMNGEMIAMQRPALNGHGNGKAKQ